MNFFYYSFIISFFLGIFLISLNINLVEIYISIFILSLALFFIFYQNQKILKKIIILLLSSFSLILSTFYYQWYLNKNNPEFDFYLNKKIEAEMIVVSEIEKKTYQDKIILKFKNSKNKAIAWIPKYSKLEYGDLIKIKGYLTEIKNFKNKNNIEFNYKEYLAKDNIFYEIKNIEFKVIEKSKASPLKENLFHLKNNFLSQIKKIFPDPEASFLGGLLLGVKEDMGSELLEDFRRTGIMHIVVLSGFNLTIIAYFFLSILAFLGVFYSTLFATISIILFTIMTGASATIVRAAIMAILAIWAKAYGREKEMIALLFLAGFLMLIFNPKILVFDPSFQLSFLATLGLLILSTPIEKILDKIIKTTKNLKEIISATLSTQIFVFPLLIFMMGEISIISPITNLIILILIPLVMLGGFLSVIISYFSFYFALFLSYPVYLILKIDLLIIRFLSDFKYAIINLQIDFWKMLIIYLTYLFIFILKIKALK